jgi:hypothetical protein
MKLKWFAHAAAVLAVGLGTAAHAQDDDWEYQEDTTGKISVAAVRYESGQALIVQCRDEVLRAVVTGLPASSERILQMDVTRADGRSDRQTFTPAGAAGAWQIGLMPRDVRFLRGGGAYSVRSAEGAGTVFRAEFDLPTRFANLDRVLTACGWAASDERDLLQRAPDTLTQVFNHSPRRGGSARRASTRPPRREAPEGPVAPPVASKYMISCIVRELRLTECRRENALFIASEPQFANVENNNGRELTGADAGAAEGRVYYMPDGEMLLVVNRVEIAN